MVAVVSGELCDKVHVINDLNPGWQRVCVLDTGHDGKCVFTAQEVDDFKSRAVDAFVAGLSRSHVAQLRNLLTAILGDDGISTRGAGTTREVNPNE